MTQPARAVDPVALAAAAAKGMGLAYHASLAPERMAVRSSFGERTFGEANANANRLARVLRRAGVGPGVGVALLARNRPEFVETLSACFRCGGRMTPINWHLTPDEVAYIVDDCEAVAIVADAHFATAALRAAEQAPRVRLKIAVGGEIPGFEDWKTILAGESGADLEDPVLGQRMLYTSGTTGRPKGVWRKPETTPGALLLKCRETAACDPAQDTALVTGPLYHAAPLGLHLLVPFGAGVGMVLMDRWDAEETLRLVDRHRVTHTHVVATMFHRLLQLPAEVKARYDTSSLRWVIHGAAPTPVHVKSAMIEWWGPVLYEYYAATEGGTFFVDSREWVERPGTVGRTVAGTVAAVLDGNGAEVPAGTAGTVYFLAPENRFEYFKAPEKTAAAYRGDYFTMGDMGYLDADGYLFLTGRSAEIIIAGGVNIYPQEIDDVLTQHPAVYEVCTVGAPNDEWGETPVSVVEPHPGTEGDDRLAQELLAFARDRLPDYKRPRAIHFATDLPRLPTGKIMRYRVREPFWAGRERKI
jgi:long-chain acyl-CoA synthetase